MWERGPEWPMECGFLRHQQPMTTPPLFVRQRVVQAAHCWDKKMNPMQKTLESQRHGTFQRLVIYFFFILFLQTEINARRFFFFFIIRIGDPEFHRIMIYFRKRLLSHRALWVSLGGCLVFHSSLGRVTGELDLYLWWIPGHKRSIQRRLHWITALEQRPFHLIYL